MLATSPNTHPHPVAGAISCPSRRAISRMGTETQFRFRIIFAPTTFAHGYGIDAAVGRGGKAHRKSVCRRSYGPSNSGATPNTSLPGISSQRHQRACACRSLSPHEFRPDTARRHRTPIKLRLKIASSYPMCSPITPRAGTDGVTLPPCPPVRSRPVQPATAPHPQSGRFPTSRRHPPHRTSA
jgi:hypothetical protein